MPLYRLFSVFVICCALTIAGCSKSSTEAGLEKEDLDGDGIGNIYDPDMDGDGIPNSKDPDIDGDGIPNGNDPSPGTNTPNYCDQIYVYGLDDEQTTGSEIVVTWNLQSSKTNDKNCVLKEGVKADLIEVTASAVGAADTKSEPTNPLLNSRAKITIPHTCVQGETVKVTYDFTEIATLIKADPNAPGWTVTQTHRADPEACDFDGDGAPDFGVQCPAEATGAYPSCSCPAGQNYNEETNECDECEQEEHEICIKECRWVYLDCVRKCESDYCIEQCGPYVFEKCSEACPDSCPGETSVSSVPESFGIATVPDSDIDNDGIPNDSDSDVDGDGVPNTSDKDIDGDGIWNKDDLDIDGDGKINSIDPDADGDGTPDAEDDTPGGPR
tara:strand:+ start:342 stop:1496 length:1155 start_codon:yes stop_codon:yes gene_type:complete